MSAIPLGVATSDFFFAHDVLALEKRLDDRGSRRGRPQPCILHRKTQFFVLDLLARCLHRAQKARLRITRRRFRLARDRFGFENVRGVLRLQSWKLRALVVLLFG